MKTQDPEQQERSDEEITVTPPPFRHSDEPQPEAPEQEPATSPTLAQRIEAMGLDSTVASQILEMTQGIDSEALSADLLTALAHGVTHDTDVENAEAAGYLRGRNEKIEAVLHPEPQDDEQVTSTPVFPRYCRRSIWENP